MESRRAGLAKCQSSCNYDVVIRFIDPEFLVKLFNIFHLFMYVDEFEHSRETFKMDYYLYYRTYKNLRVGTSFYIFSYSW